MNSGSYGPIEIFRSGKFSPMTGEETTITEGELRRIADDYDPVNYPAPVVIGHPTIDAPAYGWVERLYVEGGKLKAMIKDVVADFAEMVKAGRYKKVSISLFLPQSTANPKPDTLYLKHVGFLGAVAPAVPGLKPVQFVGSRIDCIDFTQDAAHGVINFAMEQELQQLRQKVADQELETLISEGRVLPVFKHEIASFAASLDATKTISFADDSEQTRRDWFLSYLARQPKVVSFGRMDFGPAPHDAPPKAMPVPEGYTSDPRQSELYSRAREIERREGISFAEAVDLARER